MIKQYIVTCHGGIVMPRWMAEFSGTSDEDAIAYVRNLIENGNAPGDYCMLWSGSFDDRSNTKRIAKISRKPGSTVEIG